MRITKVISDFLNSNLGSQIASATAGSAITYLLTKGGHEQELLRIKQELVENKKINFDLAKNLSDCSEKVSVHISEEN